MPIQITSGIKTGQSYIPPLEHGEAAKLRGIPQVFATITALSNAVTAERGNIAQSLPVWLDGTPLQVAAEPAGVLRRWTVSADGPTSHARTVVFPGGATITLAADTNTVISTSGAPGGGTGAIGDVAYDPLTGTRYTKTGASAWDAGASTLPGVTPTPVTPTPTTLTGLDFVLRDGRYLPGATLQSIVGTSTTPVTATAATLTGAPATGTQGVAITGLSGTVTPSNATAYIALFNGSTQEGSRVAYAGGAVPSLTPSGSGSYTVRVFDAATGGTTLATSSTISVSPATATAYTTALSATSGAPNVAVTITFTPNGAWPSGQTITPTTTLTAGSFSASSVTPTAGSATPASVTYTPTAAGSGSFNSTSSPALTNTSGAQSYAVVEPPKPLDALSGSSTVLSTFSLRHLRSAATLCLRVRRSSDNTTQDIGFSGGTIDTAALQAFCGSGDGFVTRWYDQEVQTRFLAPTGGNANQPQIVAAGVFTKLDGSTTHAGIRFVSSDTTSQQLEMAATHLGVADFACMAVFSASASNGADGYIASYSADGAGNNYDTDPSVVFLQRGRGTNLLQAYRGFLTRGNAAATSDQIAYPAGTPVVGNSRWSAGMCTVRAQGVSAGSGKSMGAGALATSGTLQVGGSRQRETGDTHGGGIATVVIFGALTTADRLQFEGDQKTAYGVA